MVILEGCVATYPEKVLAEIETQYIPEVKSVINKIDLVFRDLNSNITDTEVKDAVYCLLEANAELKSNETNIYFNPKNFNSHVGVLFSQFLEIFQLLRLFLFFQHLPYSFPVILHY